ncbi:MAG TPA: phosphatase PAP2 family protein [Gemmatimonadaceae bacterium]|nr:phosphatase PAP2 family protein [Gemmatimonadaceae bacterium]
MRLVPVALLVLLVAPPAMAQRADSASRGAKTFLTKRDLAISGVALGATALLSHWDPDIARASQEPRFQSSSLHGLALDISKVNETTLTIGGIVTWGVARLVKSPDVSDVALHATESVVLASLSSQLIRGPLGRSRPHITGDEDQYDFHPFQGFGNFKYRAFPSIHTSSSMAVATVISMELHERHQTVTPFVAPVLFAAAALPGLARIQLNQHWASDILAGAFMGVFSGYKVTRYSHDHPRNWFDRKLLDVSLSRGADGRFLVGVNPF